VDSNLQDGYDTNPENIAPTPKPDEASGPKGDPRPNPPSIEVSLERALKDDEQECQEMLGIVQDLQHEIEHGWEFNAALDEEFKASCKREKELDTLTSIRTQEMENIQKELCAFQTENERLMVELGALEEERGEASREISRLKEELESRQEAICSLQGQIEKLESALDKGKRQAASQEHESQKKIAQFEQRIGGLENRLDQTTRELFQANLSAKNLHQEKQQLEKKVAFLERSLSNFKKIQGPLRDIQNRVVKHRRHSEATVS
jgi:chromosome segregation ATPase